MGGQAKLGTVSINLPPPPEFCDLSATNRADNRLLAATEAVLRQSGNKLLSVSADCGQLAGWRTGQQPLLDDYMQYQAPEAIGTLPSETIRQACAGLQAQGQEIVSRVLPQMQAHIEAAVRNLQMTNMGFIGAIAEEPEVCYSAVIQQLKTQIGTDKLQLGLVAITAVKNRTVLVYRFTVYRNPETVTTALAKFQKEIAAFRAAN